MRVNPSFRIGEITPVVSSKGCKWKTPDFASSLESASRSTYAPFRYISSLFHWIYARICCCRSDKSKVWIELLSKLGKKFYENKTLMPRQEFYLWWKGEFNRLNPELQKLILLQDVRNYAPLTPEELEADEVGSPEEWAEKHYHDRKEASRRFVVELDIDTSQSESDPLEDVPVYLNKVTGLLLSSR